MNEIFTPSVIYHSGKLDFKFGVFEHDGFNRVMVRSRTMDVSDNGVELNIPDQSDLWYLSQKLGVDPTMKKMAIDSLPQNAIGITFVNHAEGILCVFQRTIGGHSGEDGSIRVLEYYFTFDKVRTSLPDIVDFYPMYASDDYSLSLPVIFQASVEFYQTFYKSAAEFYEKSDRTFEELFNQTREALNNIVTIRQTIHDKLSEGLMRGAMYFERPTFKLQSIMEAVLRDLQPTKTIELPFHSS